MSDEMSAGRKNSCLGDLFLSGLTSLFSINLLCSDADSFLLICSDLWCFHLRNPSFWLTRISLGIMSYSCSLVFDSVAHNRVLKFFIFFVHASYPFHIIIFTVFGATVISTHFLVKYLPFLLFNCSQNFLFQF